MGFWHLLLMIWLSIFKGVGTIIITNLKYVAGALVLIGIKPAWLKCKEFLS